jgi:hypothetical protein
MLDLWFIAECHHIVEGKRLGHWYTLPVCPGHHRGVWTPEQTKIIPPDLRIAISDGSKLLEKHYGTERELWMKIQTRLKLPAIWPVSKIVPRRLNAHNMDPVRGVGLISGSGLRALSDTRGMRDEHGLVVGPGVPVGESLHDSETLGAEHLLSHGDLP